jgi:XTP/dITP diphosphohydrolase
MKLLLATTNDNKVREIRAALTEGTELVTLADIARIPEPQETGNTFWENAREKALAYAHASGLTAVAEDSGLAIAALGGEPGVASARFLGPGTSYPQRFDEIYRRLRRRAEASRAARFVTALALAQPDGTLLFETESFIDGEIAPTPVGTNGFGYDPIFFYPPFGKTTAEMTMQEKCAVSHRARAFRDLTHFLGRHPYDIPS